jgi:hypothetical protein
VEQKYDEESVPTSCPSEVKKIKKKLKKKITKSNVKKVTNNNVKKTSDKK